MLLLLLFVSPLEFELHSHASLLLMYLTLSCFVNDIMGADYWAPNGSTHGVSGKETGLQLDLHEKLLCAYYFYYTAIDRAHGASFASIPL